MSALSEFLLARIKEDAAAAKVRTVSHRMIGGKMVNIPMYNAPGFWAWSPERVLAECEAKRQIVEFHANWPVLVEGPPEFEEVGDTDLSSMTLRMTRQIAWLTQQEYVTRFGSEPPTTPMLRALAAVYADHPDYQQEWR